jgi:3-methyladenine DNA glycosylase AlkD
MNGRSVPGMSGGATPDTTLHPWWEPLRTEMSAHGRIQDAIAMQAYMKGIAPFLGIKTPARRALFKAHLALSGTPSMVELPAVVRAAFAQPEREWHYCAVDLLVKQARKLGPEHLPLLEELITAKSWWDTVDLLASNVVGVVLKRYPDAVARWNQRWVDSPDRWLNRTAILFQLKWKHDTEEALLFANVRQHAAHPDFFIRKAIGWALRAYSISAPLAVERFVAQQNLSPLSRHEALRLMQV